MSLTRMQAERAIVARIRNLLTFAEMDTSESGSNGDLNQPFAFALMRLGITPADMSSVVNTDLAGVSAEDFPLFLDLAEYRTLLDLHSRLDAWDIDVGSRSEKFSQLTRFCENKIKMLRMSLKDDYGFGGGELNAGAVDLNFQTRGDDELV